MAEQSIHERLEQMEREIEDHEARLRKVEAEYVPTDPAVGTGAQE